MSILRRIMRRQAKGDGASLMTLRARMYGVPLAVEPSRFEAFARTVEAIGLESLTTEAISAAAPRTGARFDEHIAAHSVVAVVPIHGPLVNRPSGLDALCGVTSYAQIRASIEAAVNDPEVDRVILDIDSPGGEVAGLDDLARYIRTARDEKPIVAFVNESAFSAGYWVASQATEVVAPRLAMVGSIGVIFRHVDHSGENEKRGVTVTNVFAGAKKADWGPDAPLGDSARADLQAIVDATYDAFVADVAAGRGISEEAVRATEAGVFMGAEAVKAGLVDRIATIDEVIRAESDEGDDDEEKNEEPETPDEEEEEEEDEVTEEEHKAAVAAAVDAERLRVKTILGAAESLDMPVSAVADALISGASVESARKQLFALKAAGQDANDIHSFAPEVSGSVDLSAYDRAANRLYEQRFGKREQR